MQCNALSMYYRRVSSKKLIKPPWYAHEATFLIFAECRDNIYLNLYIDWEYMSTQPLWTIKDTLLSLWTTMSWWRHEIEPLSALLAICEGNPSVTGAFPSQRRPVARTFDVSFDVYPKKLLNKHPKWPTIWDAKALIWHHCKILHVYHHFNICSTCYIGGGHVLYVISTL